MDSLFKVPLTRILKIEEHDNSHSLEIATVYGFQVVVQKSKFKVGDLCVYLPIDSMLPINIENILFGADAKIKLHKSRLRQIKIRGKISQGMLTKPESFNSIINLNYLKEESDLSLILNVQKYEPPVKGNPRPPGKPGSRKQMANPDFHTYGGLTNLKWMPNSFDDKNVVVQEKIHGTNARAAKLPYRANTLLKKIKKLFGLAPKFENLYGSNNVDITNTRGYTGFYGEDIYGAAFAKCDAFEKLDQGEIIYGEIYGPGIQKGYSYGLSEPKFILFDVKVRQADGSFRWLNPDEVNNFARQREFDMVPELYVGPYNLALVKTLAEGPSVLCPTEKVREGCVVKLRDGYSLEGNKQALKVVSEAYLSDQSNTDEH